MKRARLRAAAADLYAIAERLDVGGFAQHAMIEFFASRGGPLQQLDRAVDGNVFLIAGDQKRDRTFWLAALVAKVLQHGGRATGDAALHVDGAAAIKKAAFHLAGEGPNRPRRFIARWHDVGMAGEADMRRFAADARVEVVGVGGGGLAGGDPVGFESGSLEELFKHAERAGIGRCYRGTAD